MKKAAKTQQTNNFRPTEAQFTAFQRCFDYFNAELFGGKLPQCILNLSRLSKAEGFFAPNRWSKAVDELPAADGTLATDILIESLALNQPEALHEISLNPDYISQNPEWVMSVLVHEMAHLQRQVTGKAPRGGYHDKEWAQMMLAVGLTPEAIGNPAKMTGQKVSHAIQKPGAFRTAFDRMPKEILLPFKHIQAPEKDKKKKANNKVKYTCSECEANAWGKPELNVLCGDCEDEDGRPCKMLAEGEEKPERFLDGDDDQDDE